MSFALGLISTILSVIGIVGVFFDMPILIIIGGVSVAASCAYDVLFGDQNSFIIEIVFALIGIFVGRLLGLEWFYGVLLGLCIDGAVMSLFSIPSYAYFFKILFKK